MTANKASFKLPGNLHNKLNFVFKSITNERVEEKVD